MKDFMLKKGGQTENVDTWLIKMTHQVDVDLLKSAINKMASVDNVTINDIEDYLNHQFNGVEELLKIEDVYTFYY